MNKTNDIIQWAGVLFLIAGQAFNAIGNMDPYNIISFVIGGSLFMIWALRVRNNAQILVNVVSVAIGFGGLIRAIS